MTELTTYTCPVTPAQAKRIKSDLADRGYELCAVPYAYFKASKDKLTVVAYQSGKLLVQGRQTREFVEFYLEPEILGKIQLGYEHVLDPGVGLERIGVDESGKGDFFGPLVVAAFYVSGEKAAAQMAGLGVRDSKQIKSAKNVEKIVQGLAAVPGCMAETVVLPPRTYNRLYRKFANLNRLLAWGHARCIENLLGRAPRCATVICDQFGDKRLIQNALMDKGRKVELRQRHRAESDLAVAAASLVARHAFVQALDRMEKVYPGFEFPKGASSLVLEAASKFVKAQGPAGLVDVAKIHFKTTQDVLGGPFPEELFPQDPVTQSDPAAR